jgi:hypothetical protein
MPKVGVLPLLMLHWQPYPESSPLQKQQPDNTVPDENLGRFVYKGFACSLSRFYTSTYSV